jgi:hypothetical protein
MKRAAKCLILTLGLLGGLGIAATNEVGPAVPAAPPVQAGQTEQVGIADPEALLTRLEEALDELLAGEAYKYRSGGTRDPFVPLVRVDGELSRTGLPGVDEIIIVGILWSETGHYALAETRDGRSLILREGSAIRNGRVLQITDAGVVVRHSHYGVTRTVTLPIASGEEERDER